MRILHVVPSYYPAIRYGGPIESVHGLAKSLARRGHDVHVFTTNIDGPNTSRVPLDEAVDLDGVKVRYFSAGLGHRFYRSPPMGRALQRDIRDFDIAHLHSVFLWPTSAAASAARRAGVPYILAPRGMLVRDLIKRKSRVAKTTWIRLLEKRNLAGAAAIHVTSDVEANDFTALGLAHKSLVTIPNGIDIPRLPESSRAAHPLLADLSSPASPPFILFLGRISWVKGLDRLIPAMAEIQDATLVIAGNDEEDYQPVLQTLAERTGVASRTRFVGPLYGPDKWQALTRAAMLVLPSYSENFGIVVLEAMAAGCPVIVTPQVGLANIVQSEGAGLVVEGEPSEIAHAIRLLLHSAEKRRTMGEAGRRSARARFSWEGIAAEMERLYRDCVS